MGIKLYLFAILALCISCSNLPEPPALNPYAIFEENNELWVMPCRVGDPKEFTFKCSPSQAELLTKSFKGFLMIDAKEIQSWRRWGKDIYQNYECKKK